MRRDHLDNYIQKAVERLSLNSEDTILLKDYERAFQYS